MNGDTAEKSQTNAEFLQAVQAREEDEPLVLAVRQVLAAWCGVESTHIRAEATTRRLHDRVKSGWVRGWDEAGFLMKLEEELKADIDDTNIRLPPFVSGQFFFWHSRAPKDLAEWLREAVDILRERIKRSTDRVSTARLPPPEAHPIRPASATCAI